MFRISSSVCLLLIISLTGLSLHQHTAAATLESDDGWEAFKIRYGKNYTNQTEENERRAIRRYNLELIKAHNEAAKDGKHTFIMGENEFIDWTKSEYQQLLGFRSRRAAAGGSTSRVRRYLSLYPFMPTYYNTININTLPTCVNWTEYGWVGPVMNQGRCGACWSYSATGSLQSQYYNYTGTMVQLSQQVLINCSYAEGNKGCNGGNMQDAFWYVQQNGIGSLAGFPDTSNVTGISGITCYFNASLAVTKLVSWRNIQENSELALQQAVALVGPVSVGIDASSMTFQLYSGGIYNVSTCGSAMSDLDHAVLVVGYGVYNGQDYWLIQNSWGTSWGINGYMMLARNANNMCGVATDATFPVINQSASPAPGVSTSGTCTGNAVAYSGETGDGSSSSNVVDPISEYDYTSVAATIGCSSLLASVSFMVASLLLELHN